MSSPIMLELGAGLVIAPIHSAYGDSSDHFGGHGYAVTAGSVFRDHAEWHPALSWANPLPREVAMFLAGEALPLVTAGRLVVLPAPLVGCTQTAIGWTDNLLVENFLGGVVDVARREEPFTSASRRRRVLDLTQIQIPFIDNVGLADLASVLEETEAWVGSFRGLLLKAMSKDDLSYERWERVASFEYDISQACRELREHLESLTRRHQRQEWTIREAPGGIGVGERGDAREPVYGFVAVSRFSAWRPGTVDTLFAPSRSWGPSSLDLPSGQSEYTSRRDSRCAASTSIFGAGSA